MIMRLIPFLPLKKISWSLFFERILTTHVCGFLRVRSQDTSEVMAVYQQAEKEASSAKTWCTLQDGAPQL
jgi:hypothetical protein